MPSPSSYSVSEIVRGDYPKSMWICEHLHDDGKYFLLTAHVPDNEVPSTLTADGWLAGWLAGHWSPVQGDLIPTLCIAPRSPPPLASSPFIKCCYSTDNHHQHSEDSHNTLVVKRRGLNGDIPPPPVATATDSTSCYTTALYGGSRSGSSSCNSCT